MGALSHLYAPGTFLAPRLMEEVRAWSAGTPATFEFLTGLHLTIAGDMPAIVHRSAVTPSGVAALRDQGLTVPDEIDAYDSRDDYIRAVHARAGRGQTAAFVYSNPPGVFDATPAGVPNRVLQYLNNKANLDAITPPDGLLPRAPMPVRNGRIVRNRPYPFVLKVASDDPNAGGKDVRICRHPLDLLRAERRLDGAETLIAEDFLAAPQNWCIYFAIRPGHAPAYLGACEQICSRAGQHLGGYTFADRGPPASAIELCRAIARSGADLGYRGLTGIDVLIDRSGRAFAIDPNFRPAASTGMVQHFGRLSRERGHACGRVAFCGYAGSLEGFLAGCRPGLKEGWLVPLALADAAVPSLKSTTSFGQFVILGDSPAHIARREALLLRANIGIFGVKRPLRDRLLRKLRLQR